MEIQNITQLKTYLAETVENIKQLHQVQNDIRLINKQKKYLETAPLIKKAFELREQLPKLPHFEQMLAVVEKLTPSS